MCQLKIFSAIAALIFLLDFIEAKPYHGILRQKRTSDQRLAELETLIALSKMNGKLVTIPIGFGKIDPNKLGRRKRSISLLLQQLINDQSSQDQLSDELFRISERKEEDGGEDPRDQEESFLGARLHLTRNSHLPIRLLE